jgi:hypothetical protein
MSFLARRASIVKELHDIEVNMMSLFTLKEIVEEINDGIKNTVEGGIPNIFLYDPDYAEKGKKSAFRFLASGAPKGKAKELGKFLPREKGLGSTAISIANEEEPFVAAEDVQDGGGSPTAKIAGIKSTCCLPLVFKGTVVGLLYVHFTEKHFFTAEERQILSMFAASAAIAIKNATTLPSYDYLVGDSLLAEIKSLRIDGIKSTDPLTLSLNLKIYNEIADLTSRMQMARGVDEISQVVLDKVSRLCSILDMPDKFSRVFRKFQKSEAILYTLPNYRDHFIHMFHVFLLGYLIINKWWQTNCSLLEVKEEAEKNQILRTWFIASIHHDIAYPIQKAEDWTTKFPQKMLDIDLEVNGRFDWTPLIKKRSNIESMERLTDDFLQRFDNGLNFENRVNFRKWFNEQLLEMNDHGALSSLSLLSYDWKKPDKQIALNAALVVLLHNYCKASHPPFGQLKISDFPLPFLLAFCDAAQEWGRCEAGADEFEKILDPQVKFKRLEVESNLTRIVLSYLKRNVDRSQAGDALAENLSCVSTGWKCGKAKMKFMIQAVDRKGNDIRDVPLA